MAFAALPQFLSSLVATLTGLPTRRTEPPQDAYSPLRQESGAFSDHRINYAELVPVGHEPIGQGSYGYVRLYKLHGTEVAVKHLRAQDWSHQELQREAQMLRKHLHPNVVLFMGVVAEPEGQLALVTEYLGRGSLWDALHPKQPQSHHQLTPERRLRIARGIAKAMEYLHSSKPSVVHRDLKSANVLLTKDWDAKVADFGLCKALPAATATATKTGTPAYAAPEVLRGSKHGVESDVFSFGVILWELATGEVPWGGMDAIQVAFRVRDGGRLQLPRGLHPDLHDLIVACWREQPSERPTFSDITQRLSSWTEDVWQQQPASQPAGVAGPPEAAAQQAATELPPPQPSTPAGTMAQARQAPQAPGPGWRHHPSHNLCISILRDAVCGRDKEQLKHVRGFAREAVQRGAVAFDTYGCLKHGPYDASDIKPWEPNEEEQDRVLHGIFIQDGAVPGGWLYLPGLDSWGHDLAEQAGGVHTVAGSVWDVARAAEAHGAVAFNTNGHLKAQLANLADLRSEGREWGGWLAERGGFKGLFVRVGGP